jgi:hypothetical protein
MICFLSVDPLPFETDPFSAMHEFRAANPLDSIILSADFCLSSLSHF